MFPIRDNIPPRTRPLVNNTLIALCAAVFLFQLIRPGEDGQALVEQFGMIPLRVLHPGRMIVLTEPQDVRPFWIHPRHPAGWSSSRPAFTPSGRC